MRTSNFKELINGFFLNTSVIINIPLKYFIID